MPFWYSLMWSTQSVVEWPHVCSPLLWWVLTFQKWWCLSLRVFTLMTRDCISKSAHSKKTNPCCLNISTTRTVFSWAIFLKHYTETDYLFYYSFSILHTELWVIILEWLRNGTRPFAHLVGCGWWSHWPQLPGTIFHVFFNQKSQSEDRIPCC